jgi:hypothetical protein
MLRWPSKFIVVFVLVLLTSCVAVPIQMLTPPPEADQEAPSTTTATACPIEEPCPTPIPCLSCPDRLHVVSPYSTSEYALEASAALHDYVITAQEFAPDSLSEALPPASAAFQPTDVLPIAALGRPVDDTTSPPPLPADDEVTPWRLYVRGAAERTEITCEAATGLVWQEVLALLKPAAAGHNVNAYSVPITEVCYLPPTATSEEVGAHADNASIWIDVAVFDLGDGAFGLYRFGPPEPGSPGGGASCKTVCAPIQCNSAIGCFVKWLCYEVC